MNNRKDLEEFIQDFGLENDVFFSEEETIPAIVGYEDSSRALVYDYDKLIQCFAEYFKLQNSEEKKEDEDYYEEALEWVEYNTLRSLPYKNGDYINPIVIHSIPENY